VVAKRRLRFAKIGDYKEEEEEKRVLSTKNRRRERCNSRQRSEGREKGSSRVAMVVAARSFASLHIRKATSPARERR